jgi:LysR family transcriptional regulator of gallate degradation
MAVPAPQSIELRQVAYFLAVVEHRSVSAAARRLGITQPALARAISKLESRLGATLLTRSSRGTVPTSEGERFLQHARTIANDCERAARDVRAVTTGSVGHVVLHCGSSFVPEIMGEAARRVTAQLPDLQLTITEGMVDEMVSALLEARCDAVFTQFAGVVPRPNVVLEPLLTISPMIVAGTSHPLAGKKALGRADLVGHAWASMDQPYTLAVLTEMFAAERLPIPQPLRTTSLPLLKTLLVSGKYLALLPRHCVGREMRSGMISRIALQVPVRRPLAGLVYLERRPRSVALDRVLQIVRDVCAGQGDP